MNCPTFAHVQALMVNANAINPKQLHLRSAQQNPTPRVLCSHQQHNPSAIILTNECPQHPDLEPPSHATCLAHTQPHFFCAAVPFTALLLLLLKKSSPCFRAAPTISCTAVSTSSGVVWRPVDSRSVPTA
jgi:hypothetical protein